MAKTRTICEGQELTGERFDAMSPAEKARIIEEIERGTPQDRLANSKPMNRQERTRWRKWKRRARPRVGKGSKMIALTVAKGLLKQADLYAKSKGMKRSALVALGLKLAMSQGS